MIVKGMNGESHNVTSQGQGNFNTVGAAAGIASLLGIDLGTLLGGIQRTPQPMAYTQNADLLTAMIATMGGNTARSTSNELVIALMSLLPALLTPKTTQVDVVTSDDKPITRYEASMMDKLSAKDSEIALLKADKYTDQKISDTYITLHGEIKDLSSEVRQNKDAQTAVNMEQAVYNGVNTATISGLKNQIAELQSLSELVVPQRKVCDTCCKC